MNYAHGSSAAQSEEHPNETNLKLEPTIAWSRQLGEVTRKLAMVWADGRVEIYAEPEEIEKRIKEVDGYQAMHLYPILEVAKLRRQLGIPLDMQEPMSRYKLGTYES